MGGGLQTCGETGGGRLRGEFAEGCWVTGTIYITQQCRWSVTGLYKLI